MRILHIFFMLMLSIVVVKAQKEAVAFRYLINDYQYPITEQLDKENFGAALEIDYSTYLTNRLFIGAPIRVGRANFPLSEATQSDNSFFGGLDLNLGLQLFGDSSFILPNIYAGFGGVYSFNEEELSLQAPLGLMLDFKLSNSIYLTTKGEYRIGFDDLRDNVQAGAGVKVMLGGAEKEEAPEQIADIEDTDGDGILDPYDACPTAAGTEQFAGCPDRDNDGIADKDDDCPDEMGGFDLRGCPDRDNDGIADKEDACPQEAGLPERQGCPVSDSDGDGIPDEQDNCPNQAGLITMQGCPDYDRDGIPNQEDLCPNVKGTRATQGCPDTDGDGIVDKDDTCPGQPGPRSNRGCPEIEKEDKETLEFATQAIQFRTGSASITSQSYQILDRIVEILKKYPDYNLSIEGYTDNVGSAVTNQRLSEQRALACYEYLLNRGISPDRMTYRGFGEENPIADNSTSAGRDQNRRVEFNVFLR